MWTSFRSLQGIALAVIVSAMTSCSPSGEAFQDLGSNWSFRAESQGTAREVASGQRVPGTIAFPHEGWVEASVEFLLDPAVLHLSETWIVLGKVDFPLEARVNGVVVSRRGVLPPAPPFVLSSQPCVFRVPTSLWKTDGPNLLSLHIAKSGDRLHFPDPVILAGPIQADFQLGPALFLNSTLFLMFWGINLLGGLYFLMLWAGRPRELAQLWFSLSTLLIGLYFLGLGSPVQILPGVLHFTLTKACLGLSIAFLIFFLLEHFQLWRALWIKIVVMSIFAASSIYVAGASSMNVLADRFTISMMPLEAGILFSMVLMVIALIRRRPQAPIIAAGLLIGVAFGSHDVYYQVTGASPVAWLQGIGFFALEASMFLSLAIHSNNVYRELERQKDTLARSNEAFARFVPRELLSFLGKDSVMDVSLGDQVQKNMTILFSDIRNFTHMTESMTPKESFNLLNAYLGRMGPIIRDHEGIVDKYIGDAIMALFPTSAVLAVQAALAMRRNLEDHNAGRARAGYAPLEMGIGLHTGALMLGTIGEDQRMDGTVISDAVNTSSRIEGLTKIFKVPIIVSQATLAADPELAATFPHRYLGVMNVKGKNQGLALYEILDPHEAITKQKLAHRDLFEAAVRSLEETDVAASAKLFRVYAERVPEDPCLDFFLHRTVP